MPDFHVCPNCSFVWHTREEFRNDKNVTIVGYQAYYKNLKEGLFLFNHSCSGTFAVEVGAFADLYDGLVFQENVADTDECPDYCLHEDSLLPCPVKCECAFVRDIIQMLKD